MKKTNLCRSVLALLLSLVMLLSSCGTYQGGTNGPGGPSQNGDNNGNQDLSQEQEREFSVKVLYDGAFLNPESLAAEGEEIEVKAVWTNGFSYHEAALDANGTANVKGLDGEYRVTLSDLPTGYSYNPNIYTVNNNKRDVVIEIYDYKTVRGTGANLYDKCIKISKIGLYSAKLDNKNDIVYYEFTPKESGKYAVESWVDISANTINPKIDIYYGTSSWKNFSYTLDDGAPGKQGSFTKNFLYEFEVSPEEVGNSYTFGVKAAVTTSASESIDIDFVITLNGSPNGKTNRPEMMVPFELLSFVYGKLEALQTLSEQEFAQLMLMQSYDDRAISQEYAHLQSCVFPKLEYVIDGEGNPIPIYTDNHKLLYEMLEGIYITYTPADPDVWEPPYVPVLMRYLQNLFQQDGAYHYAESDRLGAEGRALFDQNMYQIDPRDGFYHLYDEVKYADNGGYGPILYADITTGGRFLDAALATVEYAGNKALTVDYTKNHKHFIEGYQSLITPRGGYPNITGAYYCVYLGDDPRVTNCPCITALGCDRSCFEGCETCHDECRAIERNLEYAPGYADFANRDGRMPVTKELKDFLQSFSVSQRYFADGSGWVETHPEHKVDAPEDSQWLWACGYYE